MDTKVKVDKESIELCLSWLTDYLINDSSLEGEEGYEYHNRMRVVHDLQAEIRNQGGLNQWD